MDTRTCRNLPTWCPDSGVVAGTEAVCDASSPPGILHPPGRSINTSTRLHAIRRELPNPNITAGQVGDEFQITAQGLDHPP